EFVNEAAVVKSVKVPAESLANTSSCAFSLKGQCIPHGIKEEVNLQHDVLDGMFTFYDSTVSTLQIYQVASVKFDLILLLGLGSYLITLFSLLVITTGVWIYVRGLACMEMVPPKMDDILMLLQPIANSRSAKSVIGRLIFAAAAYYIWLERNARIFKKIKRSPEEIRDIIKGWLPGSKADGNSIQLPTIPIVASYDTFGAALALSVRRYNILLGLTSGGPYNYNGIQIAVQKKSEVA
nr:nicalin-1 [Tanacetum cinerariifolium]